MRRPLSLLFVLFLGLACASGNKRPAHIAAPAIEAQMTNRVFFGGISTSAPANIEVMVTNRAAVPITVRRIDFDSVGMVEWTARGGRDFNETVAAGQSRAFTVFGTATTTSSQPTEQLTLQVIVELQSEADRWREFVRTRL
jgi:hypothetical protein